MISLDNCTRCHTEQGCWFSVIFRFFFVIFGPICSLFSPISSFFLNFLSLFVFIFCETAGNTHKSPVASLTEIEVVDQACCLTQWLYTDTRIRSFSIDLITSVISQSGRAPSSFGFPSYISRVHHFGCIFAYIPHRLCPSTSGCSHHWWGFSRLSTRWPGMLLTSFSFEVSFLQSLTYWSNPQRQWGLRL